MPLLFAVWQLNMQDGLGQIDEGWTNKQQVITQADLEPKNAPGELVSEYVQFLCTMLGFKKIWVA